MRPDAQSCPLPALQATSRGTPTKTSFYAPHRAVGTAGTSLAATPRKPSVVDGVDPRTTTAEVFPPRVLRITARHHRDERRGSRSQSSPAGAVPAASAAGSCSRHYSYLRDRGSTVRHSSLPRTLAHATGPRRYILAHTLSPPTLKPVVKWRITPASPTRYPPREPHAKLHDMSTTVPPKPTTPDSIIERVDDESSPIETVSSEVVDSEATLSSYEILTYPADFTLEVIVDKWRKKQIVIPKFQRRFVWNQNQSSKLIDSFLKGLPVPAIFLFSSLQTNELLVVDGQQRVRTIADFFEGYFGEEKDESRKVFHLKGLENGSPFEGHTYESLEDQHPAAFAQLNNSVLRAIIIRQLHPADDTSIYHVFERLNTGGTRLTLQEIRNCIYHGKLNDLLIACNEFEPWRKIFGRPNPDKRQRDVELILRFLALARSRSTYHKPMKDFLNKFMASQMTASDSQLEQLKRMFEDTAKIVIEHLGDKPFHIRAGLNAAVFDCVFVALSHDARSIPDDLQSRYRQLILDARFQECVTSGTTDEDVVTRRLGLASEILRS